jgi:hypothetical protein
MCAHCINYTKSDRGEREPRQIKIFVKSSSDFGSLLRISSRMFCYEKLWSDTMNDAFGSLHNSLVILPSFSWVGLKRRLAGDEGRRSENGLKVLERMWSRLMHCCLVWLHESWWKLKRTTDTLHQLHLWNFQKSFIFEAEKLLSSHPNFIRKSKKKRANFSSHSKYWYKNVYDLRGL